MKIRSIVALVVLGVVAGCGGSKNLGSKKDAGPDARPTDAARDTQATTDGSTGDARKDGGTDGAPADARPDVSRDSAPRDARADGADGRMPDAAPTDAPDAAPAADAPVDAPPADAPADAAADVVPVIDASPPDVEVDAPLVVDAPAGSDGGSTTAQDAPAAGCPAGVSLETLCTAYCRGITGFCTGLSAQYSSEAECLALCLRPTWACGVPGQTTSDTLFCRATHLALLVAQPDLVLAECPNAGPASPTCR